VSCKCYLQLKNWIARPVAKHLFFHREFGFVSCEQFKCHLHNIFNNESSIHLHQPLDANSWPSFWRNIKQVGDPCILTTIVFPPTQVPFPRYGFIYNITFGTSNTIKPHEVTIGDFPTYTCMDFITMIVSSLGGWGKWVHYKHMHYIFTTWYVL
jgi:hypothetical protein